MNKEINRWCREAARQTGLCVDTVKRAYCASCTNGRLDKELLRDMIQKARQNAAKRQNRAVTTSFLYVPNNCIKELLTLKINKYRINDYELSDNAKYSHVISLDRDFFREDLKISRDENDRAIFAGITPEDYFFIAAVYTALREGAFSEHAAKNGNTAKRIACTALFNIINPGKRWDKLTHENKLAFIRKIEALAKRLRGLNGRFWCRGMAEAVENDEDGRLLYRLTLHGDNIDSCSVLVSAIENNLLHYAEEEKRIVAIPSAMLQYGTTVNNNSLTRFYLAYRICISSQKMLNVITIKTLDAFCGKTDKAFVKKYMQYLVNQGIITAYTVDRHAVTWEKPEKEKREVVIVHDADGATMKNPPAKTEDVKAAEKAVRAYNQTLKRYAITVNGKRLDCSLAIIYARGSYEAGGRLYSGKNGHQALTQEERHSVRINGKETAELDFSALHPSMIYALADVVTSGDPYDFFPDRAAAKKALLIAVNAKDREQALHAFAGEWQGEPVNAEDLFAAMERRHGAIAHFFYSDAGILLQNEDGRLMLNILSALRAKKILALPVHDSIILDRRFTATGKAVMAKMYRERYGREIIIKEK